MIKKRNIFCCIKLKKKQVGKLTSELPEKVYMMTWKVVSTLNCWLGTV